MKPLSTFAWANGKFDRFLDHSQLIANARSSLVIASIRAARRLDCEDAPLLHRDRRTPEHGHARVHAGGPDTSMAYTQGIKRIENRNFAMRPGW